MAMSEEQGKPTGNRSDLRSLIVFAIILIAILSALGFFVSDSGWQESPQKPNAYMIVHAELQNAVTGYATDHNRLLPILNGTCTNAECSNCSVIDISALLVANGGLMREAPDGLNLSARGNDNCDGNASLGCRNGSSYIWVVDSNGSVFSYHE
jgi:type II secretory pathway pseudopilin PulG